MKLILHLPLDHMLHVQKAYLWGNVYVDLGDGTWVAELGDGTWVAELGL